MPHDPRPRPLRLAFPFTRLQVGGSELRALRLAERLPRECFQSTFISSSGGGDLDRRLAATGARVKYVGERPLAKASMPVRTFGRLAKVARATADARAAGYDITNAWIYPSDVLAVFSQRLTGVPVIVAGRFNQQPRDAFGPFSARIDRIVNARVDAIVSNSEVVAAQERGRPGYDPEKVHVIRTGVEIPPPLAPDERRRVRHDLGAGQDDVLVGAVGNLREVKRHDLLLDAFAEVAGGLPGLRLAVVGEGPLRESLTQQVRRLGLESSVRLPGVIDARQVLDAFDIVVLSSDSEGLPNALLEAAAAGKPIATTAAGGAVEVVVDGLNGLVVPVGDRAALARALSTLASDEQLRRRFGEASRERMESHFGMDRFAQEWAALYERLARAKGITCR